MGATLDRREASASGRRGANRDQKRKSQPTSLLLVDQAVAQRLSDFLAKKIEFIHHPEFERPSIKAEILSAYPEGEAVPPKGSRPSGSMAREVAGYMSDLCFAPLLTKEQEHYLFRKMNYLRFRASQVQAKLARQLSSSRSKADRSGTVERQLNEGEAFLAEADATRGKILSANLRLVISIAKKYVNVANTFDELTSEGNMSLLQAAEKFDISRGNRFSTYATRAIRNNLYHYVLDKHRKRQQVALAEDDVLAGAVQEGTNEQLCENRLSYVRKSLARLMSRLDEQKQAIIRSRFGLDYDQSPQTLKEIANDLGVSRERVRQIQTRAMRELRLMADEEMIELPEYE